MNAEECAKLYMEEYNKVVEKYESKTIFQVIDNINTAILKSDMVSVNLNYNKLSEWNEFVANVQGVGTALKAQFKHLIFPSVTEFIVVFDNITKEWRFNTEAS